MPNICDFDRFLKTKCNLQRFTGNCRMKNLDDLERNVFVKSRTFKCEGERNGPYATLWIRVWKCFLEEGK